ncbi:MAG: type II toxin-antitoxin system VapC family toxin [bacterium]|nr:type II toxin-antitoxin system VapC family toxin [bacterium]
MNWVIDACFAAAWVLPDETTPQTEKFLEQLSENDEYHVPSLWWFEVSNILTTAVRRKRLKAREIPRAITLLSSLPLRTDHSQGAFYMHFLTDYATRYKLTAYDAAYLGLAVQMGAGVATLDDDIKAAAKELKLQSFL